MPKPPKTESAKLNQLASQIDRKENIVVEEGILFCRSCGIEIGMRKTQIDHHIKTEKYKNNQKKRIVQQTISSSIQKETYSKELCQAFLAVDIPLYKLKNETLPTFLEKYTGKMTPSETTLRRSFVEDTYYATFPFVVCLFVQRSLP